MGLISPVGVNGPLAFCSNRSGNWDIYRAELGQRGLSEVKRLTAAKANEVQPAWAFNADKIYYTSDADGHQQIYVMDADGRNQHVVMP
jgi:TolB protein